jgi:hypothetical protein
VLKEEKFAIVWSTDKSEFSFGAGKLVVAVCCSRNGPQIERILEGVANVGFIQLGRIITFVIHLCMHKGRGEFDAVSKQRTMKA